MDVVAVVIITLAAGGLGGIAWAVDRNRSTFGSLLPAGAAVVAAMVVWIITMAVGLGNSSATAWIPWIISIAAGGAAAWAVAGFVGHTRHTHIVKRSNEILQMR